MVLSHKATIDAFWVVHDAQVFLTHLIKAKLMVLGQVCKTRADASFETSAHCRASMSFH